MLDMDPPIGPTLPSSSIGLHSPNQEPITTPTPEIQLKDEDAAVPSCQPAISKSQMKKLKRQEWLLQRRKEFRHIEREKKRQKRKEKAKLRELNPDDATLKTANPKRHIPMKDSENKFKVVIDMDFETLMSSSEMHKSVQQIARIYSANRASEAPFQLYLSSIKGQIKQRALKTNTGFVNWDVNCSDLDYEAMLTKEDNSLDRSRIVYLSGDSDNNLASVEDLLGEEKSRIFIIGGLVDHNRHKSLCYTRALERGIKTARLPIQDHMKLNQRTILSTVTVFEILLQALALKKPWPEALAAAMPKRKIAEIYSNIRNEEKAEIPDSGDKNSEPQVYSSDTINDEKPDTISGS